MDKIKKTKIPLITVSMTAYNEKESYLKAAVESVLKQTFKDFELIVGIDNPQDKVLRNIMEKYSKKDKRVKYFVNEVNVGWGETRNRIMKRAKGKYIATLDADDMAQPTRFAKQIKYMKENPHIDMLFTWADIIGENEEFIRKFNPSKELYKNVKKNFFKVNLAINSSMMAKRIVHEKVPYSKKLRRSVDYDFWVRAIIAKFKVSVLEDYLTLYRYPNVTDYKKRVEKMRTWANNSSYILWREFFSLFPNPYYLKALMYYSIMKVFLMLPMFLLVMSVNLKDKIVR